MKICALCGMSTDLSEPTCLYDGHADWLAVASERVGENAAELLKAEITAAKAEEPESTKTSEPRLSKRAARRAAEAAVKAAQAVSDTPAAE
jgi:hypothetical protein